VEWTNGRLVVREHLGSAHTPGELAALIEVAKQRIQGDQQALDLELSEHSGAVIDVPAATAARIQQSTARILWQGLTGTYARLGFDVVGDPVFRDLVLCRVVEPTSKLDSVRVLAELGTKPPHVNTLYNCLQRVVGRDYRSLIATACWAHVTRTGGPGVALVLYDLTTLYFEAEKEDDLRKVGMSKERKVDPQITVGLLVARDGFPLDVHVFDGNKAETKTLIPVITAFQERHQISDMVVVADAGMLSAANLNALEDAGLSFIVGSRTSKAPKELEDHFGRRGNAIADDGVVELIRPMGQGRDRRDRRVVWHYKWERAKRDRRTLNAQIDRAQRVADRAEPLKKQRFVKITDQKVILDEVSIQRARESAGYKGTSPTSRRRSWTAMPSWRPITTSGKSSSPSVWPRLT
ncbi:IS1634 family transposase, partial [Dietzia cinnamea]